MKSYAELIYWHLRTIYHYSITKYIVVCLIVIVGGRVEVEAGLIETAARLYMLEQTKKYEHLSLYQDNLKKERDMWEQLMSIPFENKQAKKLIIQEIRVVHDQTVALEKYIMKIETEEAEVQRIINTKIPDSFLFFDGNAETLFFDGNAETDKTILEKKQREEQEGFQKHIESLDMKINSVKERIQQGDSLFYPNNQREEKGLSRSLPDLVKDVFRNSKTWAVVIGIKDYSQNRNGYASIPYAVRDAQAIRASLMFNWGIPEKRIFELYNENATKKRIEQLLGDELRNHEELREADQLIIYLSGHGETLVTPTGDRGFFIPYDGRKDNLYSTCISMNQVKDFSDLLPSKQMLFIVDACYSGLVGVFSKGYQSEAEKGTEGQIKKFIESRGRRILTAGASNETAFMGDEWEHHSVYTYYLLKGLQGEGDLNKDGVLMALELHLYVAKMVSQATSGKQNPQQYTFGITEGDFIFLSEDGR